MLPNQADETAVSTLSSAGAVAPPSGLPPPAVADSPAFNFAARYLPWLLGGLMLGVYLLTLNHRVSSTSLGQIDALEGLNGSPRLTQPVAYLFTRPLGWLPAAWIPLAANVWTAVCAALSLVWLARSVALLPHDLTRFAPLTTWKLGFVPPRLMTSRTAWLPPLAAVLVCGLHINFWADAVEVNSDLFNLMLFSLVVRSLLEYNASGRNAWLLLGAAAGGLCVANDSMMLVFLPAGLLGLIGVKRIFVFNERFLKRLVRRQKAHEQELRWWQIPGRWLREEPLLWQLPGCWLAGVSLFFLLPLLAGWHAFYPIDFGPACLDAWRRYSAGLLHFHPHLLLSAVMLSAMLPVILAGLRFFHLLSTGSRFQFCFGAICLQLGYGFIFLFCLWILLETPFSPRALGLGAASLPLYYLGALTIGHIVGHFLLTAVIVPGRARSRRRMSPLELLEARINLFVRLLKRGTLVLLGVCALGYPALLIRNNLSEIQGRRADPVGAYIDRLVDTLPAKGTVILGDDPFRLAFLQITLMVEGRSADYLVVQADALNTSPAYLDFLKKLNPGFDLEPLNVDPAANNAAKLKPVAMLLRALSPAHEFFWLPPVPLPETVGFFDYQFTRLWSRMQPTREKKHYIEALPAALLQTNELFWQQFQDHELPGLAGRINPPTEPPVRGWGRRFLNTLNYTPNSDRAVIVAAAYYATALNDWGVELQRAGQYPEAGRCFAGALLLNPHNAAAQINQQFNTDHQAGRSEPLRTTSAILAGLKTMADWNHVLQDGRLDAPDYCFLAGSVLADEHFFHGAIDEFERARQLASRAPEPCLGLARLFLDVGDGTNALYNANRALSLDPTNVTGLFLLASGRLLLKDYAGAILPLNEVLAQNPTNILARLNRAQASRLTGRLAAARQDFTFVAQTVTNAYPAYYGLADMADEDKDTNAAIRNYELFLKYAPTDSPRIDAVETRLATLKGAAK
jgi:tetratricopeptide (TPR) repeat protein